jgi:hypothetical protein
MSEFSLRKRNYALENLSGEQKSWLANEIIENRTTAALASKRYNLNRKLINSWVVKYR